MRKRTWINTGHDAKKERKRKITQRISKEEEGLNNTNKGMARVRSGWGRQRTPGK